MSNCNRRGHYRTNANGTTFWVRTHRVRRDHWDFDTLRALSPSSSVYVASDFLRRSNVGSGRQGCFVNPNARCPVCNVPVFFYVNSFGSRVYFDDLGPPWPKHPCTDNPKTAVTIAHQPWTPITIRGKGVVEDLIQAANRTGLFQNKHFGVQHPNEWAIAVIEHVSRLGDINRVRAQLLDALERKIIQFSCSSSDQLFQVGDFVNVRGEDFSLFSSTLMEEIRFKSGGRVQTVHKGSTAQTEALQGKSEEATHVGPFDPNRFGMSGWQAPDLRHFERGKSSFTQYIRRYHKPIKTYVSKGARTPEDFAKLLGDAHYRTAVGAQWTPRLTSFLVHFVLSGEKPPELASEMTKDESLHFHSSQVSLEKLLNRAEPVVTSAVRKGERNPRRVADRLNRANIRTAAGARWSPRLTRFLMDIIFTPTTPYTEKLRKPTNTSPVAPPRTSLATTPPKREPTTATPASLSKSQIAAKLGSLGRVVARKDQ